ncbi:MAG TPA: bacterial transcriptional activator domain-containing protein [Kaistia sp.]|nr:bacterial transcriptional activator domain-containing protein [Kaistia sp.]
MRPVSIRFLGRFELQPPSGAEARPNGVKTVLLLAWLTMPPGKMHDRKRLSKLLWPDREEAQALASLRQSLWTLRKGLGDGPPSPIMAERSSISIDPDAVAVDTVQFDRLIHKGAKADLEQVAEIYRGDFLAEFDLDDVDCYGPLLFERRRLREMALSCLRSLVEMRAGSGDPDGAVAIAQRALSFDPLQEDVHAAIIRLHRDRGRLGLAPEQYDICRELLRRELGIAPSAEVEELRNGFGTATMAVRPPENGGERRQPLNARSRQALRAVSAPGRHRCGGVSLPPRPSRLSIAFRLDQRKRPRWPVLSLRTGVHRLSCCRSRTSASRASRRPSPPA